MTPLTLVKLLLCRSKDEFLKTLSMISGLPHLKNASASFASQMLPSGLPYEWLFVVNRGSPSPSLLG